MRNKILLFYRDFIKVDTKFCHVGLGINAHMTKEVLAKQGIEIEIYGVADSSSLHSILYLSNEHTAKVIIEAPWVEPSVLENWIKLYPHIEFVVRCHSQVDFLQVEPGAIWQLRKEIEFTKKYHNFKLATNSRHLRGWFNTVFNINSLYLPNLYHREPAHKRHSVDNRVLKVGSFGALRLSKNHASGAAAAQMISKRLGKNLEFYVNVNRTEHGNGVLEALKAMFSAQPGMKLIEVPWKPWNEFKEVISEMDINFQLSHTETFNITTLDCLVEGVPSVVSPAIEWTPKSWRVINTDDLEHAAMIGTELLEHRQEGLREGNEAFALYSEVAISHWVGYLI